MEHPPGWYPDPVPGAAGGQYRYWDGATWTEHVATPGIAPAPTAPNRRSRTRGRWLAAGLALVLVIGAAFAVANRSDDGYPADWDPQVAPIATRVAALRGLGFEHPVRVRYLADAEFRDRIGVDSAGLSASARRDVRRLAATLRALGLISPTTDLVKSFDTANRSSVVAFYDPNQEEIVVRGTGPFDVERKATLAHELTHVLQDQHFGLNKMRADAAMSKTASSGALTALIEGDAERIKHEYLRGLPRLQQNEYNAAEAKTGTAIDEETANVEQIVKIELGAPYAFGPDVLAALTAKGGNAAVDDALRRPAPTDAIYLDPTAAIDAAHVITVPAPVLPRGAKRIGDPDDLGPFDLYTLLAGRIDRQVALDAADAWAGDRMVTYRSAGRVCVRAAIASETRNGAERLGRALDGWAAQMPAATITTNLDRRRSTLTSCDTGANPSPESSKLAGALALLGSRNGLLASLLKEDIPPRVGACISHGLAKSQLFADALERGDELTPSEQQEARRLTEALLTQCDGRSAS